MINQIYLEYFNVTSINELEEIMHQVISELSNEYEVFAR